MKITFPMALGLLFIGLKLGNIIEWSWLWVLMPFWLPFAVVLVFGICYGLIVLLESKEAHNRRKLRSALSDMRRRFSR